MEILQVAVELIGSIVGLISAGIGLYIVQAERKTKRKDRRDDDKDDQS